MAAKLEQQTALPLSDQSAGTLSTVVANNPEYVKTFHVDAAKIRLASAVTLSASVALVILGVAVLIGWAAGITLLKKIGPTLASMKPNTAVCFLLAGASLWLLRSEDVSGLRLRFGQLSAAIMIFIGALTLIEFLFKLNLHIDQLLFPATTALDGAAGGRMAFATALTFVLLGSALLFINEKANGKTLTDVLAGSAAAITLLTFIAYIYKVEALYRLVPFTGIAIHTMVGSFILCAGLFFARAKDGFIAVFLSNTSGGTVARRLLPVAIVIPPMLGWFRLMGERRGLYEPAFGIAVVASFLVIFLVTVIGRTARVIDSAEVVRRRANDRTRLVVEAAPSAMVMVDAQGRTALVNSQAEKLFGYSREELLGQPIEKLVPERYLSLHANHSHNFLRDPISRAMGAGGDLFGRRKDGTEVPVEIGLNPIRTDEGIFILADIIDITKRKETENTLRESEARAQRGRRIWEKTFDAIGEGILVHDHEMRIVRCNAQAAEMLNMTPAELIQLKFIDAFAMLFGQQAADYYLNEARDASSSFDARTSSGQRYLVSIFPIKNPDGDPISVVMWNDVTMLSEIQEQLGRSRRLASVGQLAAGVAHEVNNPLAAITTCAEAVMRDINQSEPARELAESRQWNYYLEEIVRQSLRCKEITRGLLDLTRQRQAKRVLCDVNAIVKQCAKVSLQRAGAGHEFNIILDAELGEVATDAEMLRQVLDNLLANAVDALEGKPGQITVSTKRDRERVAIEIADTGQGISPAVLSRIFDPFFSTKGPGKGYGLGLAISLALAESLSGAITVETKEGQGSAFKLWIPRRTPE
jgi:PAS domain S-box-containing protein